MYALFKYTIRGSLQKELTIRTVCRVYIFTKNGKIISDTYKKLGFYTLNSHKIFNELPSSEPELKKTVEAWAHKYDMGPLYYVNFNSPIPIGVILI